MSGSFNEMNVFFLLDRARLSTGFEIVAKLYLLLKSNYIIFYCCLSVFRYIGTVISCSRLFFENIIFVLGLLYIWR